MEFNEISSNEKFHLKVSFSLLFLTLRFSHHPVLTMARAIHQEPLLNLAGTKRRQRLKVDMFAFVSLMHYMKHWICHKVCPRLGNLQRAGVFISHPGG